MAPRSPSITPTEGFNAYLNLAYQSAKGKNIDSAQFNFGADDLAYIAQQLHSLGSRTANYRLRRRVVSLARHPLQRRLSCRLRGCAPIYPIARRQHGHSQRRTSALLHPGQHSESPIYSGFRSRHAHCALRRHQYLRRGLSDPQRHGRRRRCAAIRAAARPVLRAVEIFGAIDVKALPRLNGCCPTSHIADGVGCSARVLNICDCNFPRSEECGVLQFLAHALSQFRDVCELHHIDKKKEHAYIGVPTNRRRHSSNLKGDRSCNTIASSNRLSQLAFSR